MNERLTESAGAYDNLHEMETGELLAAMSELNHEPAIAVENALPQLQKLIDAAEEKMKAGGRLFYLGAGTSGRLGILDASECPPTFGVPHGMVVGLIAGGDTAIRKAVEFAEDDMEQGFKDLEQFSISVNDFVIGLSASGTTPYVLGTLQKCREKGIRTGAIVCNQNSLIEKAAHYPVVLLSGPEFVRGSTRLKAGTAQKMALNMISTILMIRLKRVEGNRMVDMQLSNAKLIDRGARMIMEQTNLEYDAAKELLLKWGSVRRALSEST